MTLVAQIIDGLGQIGTRVYPTVAALPAPRLGALVIVDGGTGGALYVGLHDVGGTLAWLPWTALYQALLTNPPPGHNTVTDSGVGDHPIFTQGSNANVFEADSVTALVLEQTGATPVGPIEEMQRSTLTPAQPIQSIFPDGTTNVTTINGYAEITVRTYSALPAANTNHLGAIVRLLGGSGVQDTFWMCVLNASNAPAWVQFIGPQGPVGPVGPAGPTGPAGQFGPYPALPTGGAAIDFWMEVAAFDGTYLPYILAFGYVLQVIGVSGRWGANLAATGDFIVDGEGNNQIGAGAGMVGPSPIAPSVPIGKIIKYMFQNQGIAQPGWSGWGDAETAYTMPQSGTAIFKSNMDNTTADVRGNILAHVKITSPVPGTSDWTAFINFGATAGGFTPVFAGSGTRDGAGWHEGAFNNGDVCRGIWIGLSFVNPFVLRGDEFVGVYTPPATVPPNGCRELGEVAFSSGSPLTSLTVLPSGNYDRVGPYSNTNEVSVCTRLEVFAFVDYTCAGGAPGGTVTMTGLTIKGHGPIPSELAPYIL